MNARDFAYWLQGFFELTDSANGMTAAQTEKVRRHLNMVFVHDIDPSMGPPEHRTQLSDAHEGRVNLVGLPEIWHAMLSELDLESSRVVAFAVKLGFTREQIAAERGRRRAEKVGGPAASSGLGGVRINC